MEKMDVVIVGAGLAGLAAAYGLADEGLEILVAEKGDFPGSKNVTGGRIYLNPVRDLFPGLWDEAPLERHVVREKLTMMAETASTSVELRSNRFEQEPYHSFTVLRAKFDRWLGDKVAEKGAFVIPKSKVDDLVFQDGRVAGIVADGDEIYADVVVAADGVLSLMAEKAGLQKGREPKHYAVSIKEVLELPRQTIEDRFNLEGDQGAAQLFFGTLTQGMMGGGFLYTNLESISLGLVVGIEALMDKEPKLEVHQMMEDFKQRPEIRALIKGGEVAEYSAHVITEGGIHAMPKLFADGILVVGDAAGFGLNMLMTVRGMEYALASGALAAQAIKRAREQNDFSAANLSYYEQLIKDSFIYKELQTFSHVLNVLENPRLFNVYPQVFCGLFEKLMWIDKEPKQKLSTTALQEFRGSLLSVDTIKDAFSFLKI
jgi:electron transfer flavoprotein-quinone oxidoreductase